MIPALIFENPGTHLVELSALLGREPIAQFLDVISLRTLDESWRQCDLLTIAIECGAMPDVRDRLVRKRLRNDYADGGKCPYGARECREYKALESPPHSTEFHPGSPF